ncbi:hypothetical protein BDV93DRAFT_525123 [Ceratobasidium sp. AG-I]|nr:hypothetical protein BDV93DRAFT_525123 [Ceratobasidium sp. AG-I]
MKTSFTEVDNHPMDLRPTYKPDRHQPPQPLGSGAKYFSVSAATPPSLDKDSHPSGLVVRIKLNNPHPDQPFRTGELIHGQVHIYSRYGALSEHLNPSPRLSLRAYFESRTLFWGLEQKASSNKAKQKLDKAKSSSAQHYESVMRHEVHRGLVPADSFTLSWSIDGSLPKVPGSDSEAVYSFSFQVPRRMRVNEYNKMEGAPRDMCAIERSPPPTFRDARDGSVQWVAEAVLSLDPSEPPEQDEAMLRLPTQATVVTRLVFPVTPALEDVGVLREELFFGNDPADSYGSRRLSEVEQESAKKATLNRVRSRGGQWETYVKNIRLANGSILSSELYAHSGARFATDSPNMPLVLFLKRMKGSSNPISSLFRSKSRSIFAERASISLYRTTSTRGGKDAKPHVTSLLVQQHEMQLGETSQGSASSSKGGLLLPCDEHTDAVEIDLTFDLQNVSEIKIHEETAQSTPAKLMTPSFRTPNIQHEYLLTVSVWLSEDAVELFAAVARFPVQVVPGDENVLPLFEDVVKGLPAFEGGSGLPQYQ